MSVLCASLCLRIGVTEVVEIMEGIMVVEMIPKLLCIHYTVAKNI